jgi:3-methylcrotonyl-CoA carboxylase alpha subunit
MSEKTVTIAEQQTELRLEREGHGFRSGAHRIEILGIGAEEIEVILDGRRMLVPYVADGTKISFALDGELWSAEVADKGAQVHARHRDHSMEAPMPGVITKILVAPGDVVKKGAPLLVLEAMKMEHQIAAPHDGTIAAIHCREGELVQPGVELVTVE